MIDKRQRHFGHFHVRLINRNTGETKELEADEIDNSNASPKASAPALTESAGLGGGAIAGIIIGCLVVLAVVAGLVVYMMRKKAHSNL